MTALLNNNLWLIFFIISSLFLPASLSQAAVVVFDRVTTVGNPVYLKVLTKGRFFPQAGKLVEFYLDKKSFGKNLTGGDGYGYLKYTPKRAGMIKVEASSNGERGSGLILVMKKKEKAIMIEIEGGFKDAFFSKIAKGASRKAVEKLIKKYRIIYISRFSGIKMSRRWLDQGHFPESVILRWRGSEFFAALKAKGIKLHAIIGSAGLISKAAGHIEKRYTFDQTEDGQKVNDWDEILQSLN